MTRSAPKVLEISGESSLRLEVLESDRPVFVDFWSPNCTPCKPMGVIFEQIASQYRQKAKFAKVNVRANRAVAQKFGIRSVPTLVALLNGEVVDVRVGFAPDKVIERFVRRTIDRAEGRTTVDRILSWFRGERKGK